MANRRNAPTTNVAIDELSRERSLRPTAKSKPLFARTIGDAASLQHHKPNPLQGPVLPAEVAPSTTHPVGIAKSLSQQLILCRRARRPRKPLCRAARCQYYALSETALPPAIEAARTTPGWRDRAPLRTARNRCISCSIHRKTGQAYHYSLSFDFAGHREKSLYLTAVL